MFKPLQYTLGILLILLGIAGLFLPFLQGILLIVLGVFVLRADKVSGVWSDIKDTVRIPLLKR